MKKLTCILLTLILLLSLAACGNKSVTTTNGGGTTTGQTTTTTQTTTNPTTDKTNTTPTAPETNVPTTENLGGEQIAVGAYRVEFVGAEALEDDDGESAIRVWYDFTNASEQVVTPFEALTFTVEQDGDELDIAYLYDDVPEAANGSFAVAPGYTARCAQLYGYDPALGAVTATLGDYYGEAATCEFDPNALPGAPEYDGPAWEADPGTPAYMLDVSETGEGVEILGVEAGVDWDDESVIIVRYRFTNNSGDDASFFSAFAAYAVQDGFGLERSESAEYAREQENVTEEIAPGESIECACAYLLRTDDPVAVVLKEFAGDGYFGQVFEVPAAG